MWPVGRGLSNEDLTLPSQIYMLFSAFYGEPMSMHSPKCNTENPDTKQFCGDCGTQLTPAKEGPIPTQTLEVPKEELTTGSTFAGRYQII